MKNWIVILLLIGADATYGQLGFCEGSKGNAIFFENFGSGTSFGPPLPAGTTSYTYVNGILDTGEYTLHYRNTQKSSWHDAPDHTFDESPDGLNGKALIVNASETPGQFYKRVVSGLCVNTNFEFSAWIENVFNPASGVCDGGDIPVDVTFEIWDALETTLLKSGSTGPIPGTLTPIYKQYGLTFTTFPGQTAVVLKMRNNGAGGCGNNLALDDIAFRSCGDFATITSTLATGARYDVCETALPLTVPLHVEITNLTPHAFQWQESLDTSVWTDIPGQNGLDYNANLTETKFFRVKIAQDAANLANPFCYTISETFAVVVSPRPIPPVSLGDVIGCSADPIPPLVVDTDLGISADWFDAPVGGNLLQANSDTFQIAVSGTYYAEAFSNAVECRSATRTPVTLTVNPSPVVSDEARFLCEGQSISLDAGVSAMTYLWSTGETTQTINVNAEDDYTVTVTAPNGCVQTKTIVVNQVNDPQLVDIRVFEDTIALVVLIDAESPVEYSIDGIHYQPSEVFTGVPGGYVTGYIRAYNGCGEDSRKAFILFVPKYFTPNGDGYNDVLQIPEMALFPNFEMKIFDRYGKLIHVIDGSNPKWDGRYDGKTLPASDYWYRILLGNGMERRGHFSIKR